MADAKMKVSQMGAVLAMDDDDLINVVTYNDQSQTYVSGKATGAKVKEYMVGDNDISALGDGSVTGAILNVKSTSETADSNIAETMAQNGAHNLCPFPYEDGTSVYSGITITVNNDGTMTGSGTPNDSGAFFFYKGTLAKKSYKICFDGSFSGASIKLKVYDATAGQTLAELSSGNTVDDFTIDSTNATHTIWIYFNWNNEVETVTISGGFVLLVAIDPSTTYAPYAMTNRELTEKKVVDITPETGFTVESNNSFECAGVLYLNFMLSASTAVQTTVLQTVASINKTPSVASQLSGAGLDDNGYLQGAIGGRLFTNGYIVAAAPTGTTKLYIEGVILL